MLSFKGQVVRLLFCFITLCFVAAYTTTAQTPKSPEPTDDKAVLKELLQEVRLLRLALERNNLMVHRFEVLAGRLRAQQDHVDRLAQDLEATRKLLSEPKYDPANAAELIKDMEKRVEVGTESEGPVKALKAQMAAQDRQRQRLIDREKALAAELETEKAQLSQLKTRLDILEQEFETPAGVNKPPQKQKQE